MKVKKVIIPDQISQFSHPDDIIKKIDSIASKLITRNSINRKDILTNLKMIIKSDENNLKYFSDKYQNEIIEVLKLLDPNSLPLIYEIIEIITENRNLKDKFLNSLWSTLRMCFTHINKCIREDSFNFFFKNFKIFSYIFNQSPHKKMTHLNEFLDDLISSNFILFQHIDHKKITQLFRIFHFFLLSEKPKNLQFKSKIGKTGTFRWINDLNIFNFQFDTINGSSRGYSNQNVDKSEINIINKCLKIFSNLHNQCSINQDKFYFYLKGMISVLSTLSYYKRIYRNYLNFTSINLSLIFLKFIQKYSHICIYKYWDEILSSLIYLFECDPQKIGNSCVRSYMLSFLMYYDPQKHSKYSIHFIRYLLTEIIPESTSLTVKKFKFYYIFRNDNRLKYCEIKFNSFLL
ncbi:hypothetical protein HZS_7918 [Henneguya salminicola]|nr:hypothetical protein HZS_7918 [Henneguya salminicola]